MISVIIPTHNRIEDLKKALNSVFTQTVLPSEVIVVDDGSLPAVPETIFDEAPVAIKTLLLRNEQPKGAPSARNAGVNAASGEWIAFLDDDDEFFPEKIEAVKNAVLEKGSDIDLIYHPGQITMVNEGISYVSTTKNIESCGDVFSALLLQNHIGGTSMVAAKRSSLLQVGCFDSNLPAMQDYDLWLRMAKAGCRFKYLDGTFTKYNSYTNKNQKSITKSFDSYTQAREILDQKYSEEYSRLPGSKRLLEMRKHNRKIRCAYLNKQYFRSIGLNAIGFLKFRKMKYALSFSASFFGPTFIFWLRSKKSRGIPLR